MNNSFNNHENLQDPSSFAHLINQPTTKTPLLVQEFVKPDIHNSNTSPHPVVHKFTHYPQSWDKNKVNKFPSPHQIAEIILSNRQFVIVCTVIMSVIFLIYALKLVISVIAK